MRRTEFEDILILDTPYYRQMTETYRDTKTFNRYVAILRNISKSDGFIARVSERGGKELVFLGRKIFALQQEFVAQYRSFISDECSVDQWESFFERYSSQLSEIYQRFVEGITDRMIIFEIVTRKLIRDLITQHIVSDPIDRKIVIAERFGVVVNQLFSYLRHASSKDNAAVDELISNSYEKIPFIPRCGYSETMRLLAKSFLDKGLPGALYTAVAKAIMTTYYTDTKTTVINSIERVPLLSKAAILDVFRSHFFFPDEKTLEEVLNLLRVRAREMLSDIVQRKESVEQQMRAIKQKTKDVTESMKEQLTILVEKFSNETAIDNKIKNLRRNLITNGYDLRILRNQYLDYVNKEKELKAIVDFKTTDLLQFVVKNEWDPFIILLHNPDLTVTDEQMQVLVKNVMSEIKAEKHGTDVLYKYRVTGFLKDRYDTRLIMETFRSITQRVIRPLIRTLLMEELVEYYPKLSGVVSQDSVRYVAEEALAGRVNVIEKDVKVIDTPHKVSELTVNRYKDLVSVLIYDIRGSTFMGTKLRDAKVESEIRNFFQESMLSAVEKYGGIPIKDTGDGGIVLFTANHNEIKRGETSELKPGSALNAVRSGIEMVKQARAFVQDNIDRYKDWFREGEERKISFEGATYATLPPAYQSIFQIGVGIASGVYPKELYLEKNAFEELDLTGMLVREANFYSKVKAKSKSTVMCDDATVYNLLLNVNKFSFLSDAGLSIDPLLLDVEQGLEYWINQKFSRRGFILDLYKIFVSQIGQEYTRAGSLKIMLGMYDLEIDETGEIKDSKGGRGKFLFEITTETLK
ncbi:MAG: hypothetical protein JSW02_00010 [candidate division WOR-3 bacterium]|nr:MAG: hypothetical protein JSW02_00010 [candidate division WOR-3 bacterium]